MKYFIFLSILLATIVNLHAQSGWRDMGAYKESIDTTGALFQSKATPDGKYLYTITRLGVKNLLYLQKWDIDSGVIVLSREIVTDTLSQFNTIDLNCDANSYSIYCELKSMPGYRMIVYDNDSGNELLSRIDNNSGQVIQMDYDSVLKCFYVAYNSIYSTYSGPDMLIYSNGSIKKKLLSGDTLLSIDVVLPNTERFIHKIGTSLLAVISNYNFDESKNREETHYRINRLNFIGLTPNKGIMLDEYRIDYKYQTNQIAVSSDGKYITSSRTIGKNFSSWYVDSALRAASLGTFSKYTNSMYYTPNNKYLIVNSPEDSSIYLINPLMRAICGTKKLPIVHLISTILSLPNSSSILATCSDGKLRIIPAIQDTSTPKYNFIANKKSIRQHEPISFYSIVPSYDSCRIVWEFGDGKNSKDLNTTHIFDSVGVFDVTMNVTDTSGIHTIIYKKMIEVIALPNPITLDFDADVHFGDAPLQVKFTNKSTGTILSYKWDFGDGTSSTAKDTVHVFTQQRSYTITLTVNNGIKDTSLTKIHYINADNYPAFLLKTTLKDTSIGSFEKYNRYTVSNTKLFENLMRSTSGAVFIKELSFTEEVGSYIDGTALNNCRLQTDIYSIQDDGTFGNHIGNFGNTGDNGVRHCTDEYGTWGLLHNDLLSYFVLLDGYLPNTTYLLNGTIYKNQLKFPNLTNFYTVRALHQNIDCYVFRNDRTLGKQNSYIRFVKDTTKLISTDIILDGYALPAIESNDGKFMAVVSYLGKDSTSIAQIHLRWYNAQGIFIDSVVIPRSTPDILLDIIPLPQDKYMLCGLSAVKINGQNQYTNQGIILVINSNGNIEFSKHVPQWSMFKKITKMDDNTYAITGTPYVKYPGFIAVKSDGTIVGDFRGDITIGSLSSYNIYNYTSPITCPTCVDVSFGKTMNTVIFTRNDGYNAELYTSNNPYLKDISVSVEEPSTPTPPLQNSLVVSPNPTDGHTAITYTSTAQQSITLTITTLLGEVYNIQSLDIQQGENTIPIDLSRFGAGMAFVSIAGSTDVVHAQICVVR